MNNPKISLIGESMVGKTSFILSSIDNCENYENLRKIVKRNNSGQTKIQTNYKIVKSGSGDIVLESIKFDESVYDDKAKISKLENLFKNYIDVNKIKSCKDDCFIEMNAVLDIEKYEKLINSIENVGLIKSITFKLLGSEKVICLLDKYKFESITFSDCRGFFDETEETRKNYNEIKSKISDNKINIEKDDNSEFTEYILEERGLVDTDYVILLVKSSGLSMTKEYKDLYGKIFDYIMRNNDFMVLGRQDRLTQYLDEKDSFDETEYRELHNEGSETYKKIGWKYINTFNETTKLISDFTNNNKLKLQEYLLPELKLDDDKDEQVNNRLIGMYYDIQSYILDIVLCKIKSNTDNMFIASKYLNDEGVKRIFNKKIDEMVNIKYEKRFNDIKEVVNFDRLKQNIDNEFTAGEYGLVGPRYGITTYICGYGLIGKCGYAINRYCFSLIHDFSNELLSNDNEKIRIIGRAIQDVLYNNFSVYYSTFGCRFISIYELKNILDEFGQENIKDSNIEIILKNVLHEYIKQICKYLCEMQKIKD